MTTSVHSGGSITRRPPRPAQGGSALMESLRGIAAADTAANDALRENANVDGQSSMGAMLRYGTESAKHLNLSEIIAPEYAAAHRLGDIHIHDLDFYTLTTTCCQISLTDLFRGGFSTGHGHLREPQSIGSYAALACIAIQSNQNDQHGGQAIPNFDVDMAPGVRRTLESRFLENADTAARLLGVEPVAVYPPHVVLEPSAAQLRDERAYLRGLLGERADLEALHARIRERSVRETERLTYQAMEAFIANLNTMNSRAGAQTPFSSINYGTDVSPEARMVVRQLLLATEAGLGNGETAIFPIQIFRVQKGVNLDPGDPNHDLLQLACRVTAGRLFPNFSFQDAPFNRVHHVPGRPETEIAYMGCRTRVMANVHDPDRAVTHGRGNLSFTTINLPRLAIEADGDVDCFLCTLDERIQLVIGQLMERFTIQAGKRVRNFPFLMGQGVWIDSERLGGQDRVREVLKHGTLSVGFIGLAEAVHALGGVHHGQSQRAWDLAYSIVVRMRWRMNQAAERTGLNFSLLATPAEGLAGRFVRMDQRLHGIIPGVTDKEYYTNSFHIPVGFDIGLADKIAKEAPFHALTNAGHITYVEIDGDPSKNVGAIEQIVRFMAGSGIGYGAINHTVDHDPVCGYTGVIDDRCPGCGRAEGRRPFDRIRRITGYLVGTLERFNDAKRAEVRDRVTHAL